MLRVSESILVNLETTVTEQAWSDQDFHKRLLADPRGTIEQEMGCSLPDGLRISVHQQSADHLHIVLPAPPGDA